MDTETDLEALSSRELHDMAVHRAVRHGDVKFLWELLRAIPAAEASEAPARVLGLSASRGALAPGMVADLVVTDSRLALRRVMRAGRWLE